MKTLSFPLDINQNYNVKLEIVPDDLCIYGELSLSSGKSPIIRINQNQGDFKKFNNFISDKENIKLIQCFSGNTNFTLIDCDIFDERIYPKYIIMDTLFSEYDNIEFNGISICLENFAEWFINKRSIKCSEKGFENEIFMDNFKVKVNTLEGKEIEISNRYNCAIKNDELEKRKIIIEEYPTINIESINACFSIEDLIELDKDIRIIFSFLIGCPSSTLYLWGTIKNKDGNGQRWFPIYYPSISQKNKFLNNHRESLIQYRYLSENEKWDTIFANYFATEKFKKFWSRMLGLLNYSDIWDYEFLGYVSILNKFVEKYAKGRSEKLPVTVFKELVKSLNDVLEKELKEWVEKDDYQNISKSIKDAVNKIANTDIITFQDRFDLWISELNKDIKKIIGFTDYEFSELKRIRDAVAHGRSFEYKEEDHTKNYKLKNKLVLLLFYLIYLDLGLDGEDFIKNLSMSIHLLIRNSDLNFEHLDRVSGKFKFIKVDNQTFDKIKSLKKINIILEEKEKGKKYYFNEEKTNVLQKNWPTKVIKNFHDIRDYIKDLYSNEIKDVIYKSGYIENEENDETIKIFGMCLVKR